MKLKSFITLMTCEMAILAGLIWYVGSDYNKPIVKTDDKNIPGFQENKPTLTPWDYMSPINEDLINLKKEVAGLKEKIRKEVEVAKVSPTPTVIYFNPVYIPSPSTTPTITIIPTTSPMPVPTPLVPLRIENCRNNLADGVYEVRTGLQQYFGVDKVASGDSYEWFTAWGKPVQARGIFWFTTFNFYGKHLVRLTDKNGRVAECWVDVVQPE